MNFNPRTKQQINETNLLEKGVYSFEVFAAYEKVSKAGNEMIELKLYVYDQNNKAYALRDYLLSEGRGQYKLLSFCEAAGLTELYESGELQASSCVGITGECEVAVREAGEYPAQNIITDYVVRAVAPQKQQQAALAQRVVANDDVPF